MKKYEVYFRVYDADGHFETTHMTVEAGNKKMAFTRALSEIAKNKNYSSKYNKIMRIEEVA